MQPSLGKIGPASWPAQPGKGLASGHRAPLPLPHATPDSGTAKRRHRLARAVLGRLAPLYRKAIADRLAVSAIARLKFARHRRCVVPAESLGDSQNPRKCDGDHTTCAACERQADRPLPLKAAHPASRIEARGAHNRTDPTRGSATPKCRLKSR
jgi:hypothetical protein